MTLTRGKCRKLPPPTNLYSDTTRRIPRAVLPLPVDTADAVRQSGDWQRGEALAIAMPASQRHNPRMRGTIAYPLRKC